MALQATASGLAVGNVAHRCSLPTLLRRCAISQKFGSRVSLYRPGPALRCAPGHAPALKSRSRKVATTALPAALAELSASPYRDGVCAAVAAIGALVWVKIFNVLAVKGVLDQKLSRKLVHSTAGPLFVCTWPLFSALPEARLAAAIVPCLQFARLFAVGSGLISDPGLVKSVSREGDRRELLKGPLYYCVVLIACTLAFWRENPAGLVAIAMMCGGDGLADIVGRRFGSAKLPFNSSKSWAGSAAMFLAGLAMALGFVYLFCGLGFFPCYSPQAMVPAIVGICAACTLVESLPVNNVVDDNLSVPGVAVGLSLLLMPMLAAASAAATSAASSAVGAEGAPLAAAAFGWLSQ